MDFNHQLRKLFPGHQPSEEPAAASSSNDSRAQAAPLICKYEKRNGKPVTIVEGFEGSEDQLKELAKGLKVKLGVGGSHRDGEILVQGDCRDKVMALLKEEGFKVKRVGG